ncbi:hypothetical protein EB796_024582 [Bugula neritina]|uniref:Protein kinase domain-containing protein n=1 Tax=Bugula neritina TaxID=10212 RepID=A0A7J7IT68_BUGNE|nr:hypothetical protein EB796_024582 [Bugula neritina]
MPPVPPAVAEASDANKEGENKEGSQAPAPGSLKQSVLEAYGYQVSHTVGNGSYAVVKAAYSTKHKAKIAVKIVQKNKAPRDYIEKFLPREIELIKVLRHPNLVCFLQSIETTNRVYLVMELAEGGDLLDVMNRQRYVKEPQAGIWFKQMVEGIGYCHSKGVVHRDLKCENVLLDKHNHVKITDFGFARANLTRPDGTRVLSRTYCGSYSYAAPEVLTGTPYDPFKSDIWSLAVILFIMVKECWIIVSFNLN